MKSEDVIVAKADVKNLYDEVLSKSSTNQKKMADIVATAFLLGQNGENISVSEQNESA